MNSLEFLKKEIEATKKSYEAFELDYQLFHRESDNRDAENLMNKLIQLQQVKADLEEYKKLKAKDISKKVVNKHKEYVFPNAYRLSGICPNCKNHVDENKYCSICGQKLDWSE